MNSRLIVMLVVLVLLGAAVVAQAQERELNAAGGRLASTALPEMTPARFAPAPPPAPAIPPAGINEPGSLVNTAYNYDQVMQFLGVTLSPAQETYLAENRFLLLDVRDTSLKELAGYNYYNFDNMLAFLDAVGGDEMDPSTRAPHNARLITPDPLLHAFHRFFENTLEYLEEYELGHMLRLFLAEAQAKAFAYMEATAQDRPLYDRYHEIAAQLTVARVLLENGQWHEEPQYAGYGEEPQPDDMDTLQNARGLMSEFSMKLSPEMNERVAAELELIYAASQIAPSPLFGQYDETIKSDYTQYTPRSHYTKSSALRAYFRAMMYLGRNSYILNSSEGAGDALLMAHLMAGTMSDGRPLLEVWKEIMDITSFYAGPSDDIGYPEWRDFLVQVLGTDQIEPRMALDPDVQAAIARNLDQLRPPRILSDVVVRGDIGSLDKEALLQETKAFRVFGQRFTFDAWVLNQLTAGAESTDAPLPSTPSALFVPAAMGDEQAREFSGIFVQDTSDAFSTPDGANQFLNEIDKMGDKLARVTEDEWFGSLGSVWLKLLSTLTTPYGEGYPLYMRGDNFQTKQIQTFLGSYTELKHDTLLYAKQSYAEMGGPDWDNLPPVPMGFVEPNMAFWYELDRLIEYAEAGFRSHGILEDQLEEWGTLGWFKQQVAFYTTLAEKELRGEAITEDEYEELRTMSLSHMAAPIIPGSVVDEDERRVALIADIHTDALAGQILYQATGEPYVMIAFVENEGTPRLVTGVVYNHFEFTGPLGGNRLTDEDWRAIVYDDPASLPPTNAYYQDILVQ